jgi:hypothetical protein
MYCPIFRAEFLKRSLNATFVVTSERFEGKRFGADRVLDYRLRAWQRLIQSIRDGARIGDAGMGYLAGQFTFYRTSAPNSGNSWALGSVRHPKRR